MLPRAPAQNTQIRTIWRRFRQIQTDVHNGGYTRALSRPVSTKRDIECGEPGGRWGIARSRLWAPAT